MQYLKSLLVILAVLTACQSDSKESAKTGNGEQAESSSDKVVSQKADNTYDSVHFGEKVTAEGAVGLDAMLESMGDKSEYKAKVKGKVTAVCQKKGCWMKLQRPDGKPIRVTFKDYGFFVPKDLAGNKVAMKGKAYTDTITVKQRRHFARDEGKSEETVKNITEPKTRLAFKAVGVKILQ